MPKSKKADAEIRSREAEVEAELRTRADTLKIARVDIMPPKDVGLLLGVPAQSIRNMCHAGHIAFFRVGAKQHSIRITLSALVDYILSNTFQRADARRARKEGDR